MSDLSCEERKRRGINKHGAPRGVSSKPIDHTYTGNWPANAQFGPGYMRLARELKRVAAGERNDRTPDERRRVNRHLQFDESGQLITKRTRRRAVRA